MADETSTETSLETLSIAELVECSSLGSDEARYHRSLTPPSVKLEIQASLMARPDDDGADPAKRAMTRDAGPYFFLSYAREANGPRRGEDPFVRRLFQLMCIRLTQTAPDAVADEGASASAVLPGYLAAYPLVGPDPRPRMLQALSSCRVFVPLLSPEYLGDRWCRDEWDTFRRRDDERRRHHPFDLSAIVPVLWTPMADDDVPEWLHDVVIVDPTLGAEYAERGLRALMAESSSTCQKVVLRIVRRIHDVAECLSAPATSSHGDD